MAVNTAAYRAREAGRARTAEPVEPYLGRLDWLNPKVEETQEPAKAAKAAQRAAAAQAAAAAKKAAAIARDEDDCLAVILLSMQAEQEEVVAAVSLLALLAETLSQRTRARAEAALREITDETTIH